LFGVQIVVGHFVPRFAELSPRGVGNRVTEAALPLVTDNNEYVHGMGPFLIVSS
jgi:hypothetical protein